MILIVDSTKSAFTGAPRISAHKNGVVSLLISRGDPHLKGFTPNTVMAENYRYIQLPAHNLAVLRLLPRVYTCMRLSPLPRATQFAEYLGSKVMPTKHPRFFRGMAFGITSSVIQ